MKRTLLLALALVALLAPAGVASATTPDHHDWDALFAGTPGHMDIIVGPDAVRFTLDEITLDGAQAAQLRGFIDTTPGVGDNDGVVSENEAKTFEAFVTASVNAMMPNSFDMELVKMDGRTPYSEERPAVHVESLKIHGAEGDVTSRDPITADLSVLLRFESVDASKTTHHLRLENLWGDFTGYGLEHAPDMEIRIQGYRSWTIQEDSIRPSAVKDHYQNGMLVFSGQDVEGFKQSGSGLEFEIEGDPNHRILGDAEESPAVAPLVVLLMALGALLGLRRRRAA